eukprot:2625318-Pyramimonas_sp.AAC.1
MAARRPRGRRRRFKKANRNSWIKVGNAWPKSSATSKGFRSCTSGCSEATRAIMSSSRMLD